MDEKRLVDGTTALAEKQARVIKIEAVDRPQNVRLRVAAYTRVSSDSEDQLNSFAAQNRYYTELISSKAEWRIQAVLGNPHHPEYGVATIPFPIPHDQYAHCMPKTRRAIRLSFPPTRNTSLPQSHIWALEILRKP